MTFERQPIRRLGDVFLGKMIQPQSKASDDIAAPYLRAAHIQPHGAIIDVEARTMWFGQSELELHDLRSGDVVVVEGGAGFGRAAVLREDRPGVGFQNSVIRIRPREERADGGFICYALQSALGSGEIAAACFTATIPHFTADKVGAFPVPSPAAPDQRAIAAFLDRETAKIDTLIAEQQRLVELLRERRVAAISDALSGWEPVRLRRLVEPSRPMAYGILQCGDLVMEGVPYVGPSDMPGQGRSPRLEDLRRTAPEVAAAYPRSVLRGGDIVVSIGPAYGKVALIDDALSGANLTQDTVRVAIQPDRVDRGFLVWVLGSQAVADYWDLEIQGATFRRLNLGTLARTPTPLPPLAEQRRISLRLNEKTAKIDHLITDTERFIELSKERRSALITAAVTGEIDVRGEVA